MRLICPNCDAEYEVESALVPPAGRDVQCSNCGHSWFQMPPEIEAEAEAEAALYEDAAVADAPAAGPELTVAARADVARADVARADVARADVARADTADAPDGPAADFPQSGGAETVDPGAPPLAGRTLDDTVLAVLREEAERESEARRAETVARKPVVETQTEMGLQVASTSAAGVAARRVARLKGIDPDAPPPAPPRPQTRRDLLPEIDEINSSLRASSEKRSGESGAVAATMAPPVEAGRRSFRNGFVLMMVVVVIAVVAYVMAPRITDRIPGAGPAMASYVAAVDSARLRLDASMKALIAALHAITGDNG